MLQSPALTQLTLVTAEETTRNQNMFFFSQIQMTIPLKLSYSDKLNKLEKQYERLLVSELSSHDLKFVLLEMLKIIYALSVV